MRGDLNTAARNMESNGALKQRITWRKFEGIRFLKVFLMGEMKGGNDSIWQIMYISKNISDLWFDPGVPLLICIKKPKRRRINDRV